MEAGGLSSPVLGTTAATRELYTSVLRVGTGRIINPIVRFSGLSPFSLTSVGSQILSGVNRANLPIVVGTNVLQGLWGYNAIQQRNIALLRGEREYAPIPDLPGGGYSAALTNAISRGTLSSGAHGPLEGIGPGGLESSFRRHLAGQRQHSAP